MVFPTFFNLSLNFAIRSSWSEPQSAPVLVFAHCMCRVFSCVVERGYLLWPVHSLGKILLAFAPLHFVLQGQICLLFQISLPTFTFQSPKMKRTYIEGLVGLSKPFNFSFFIMTGWSIDLDYSDIECFALETNRDHSVIFEIAPKYWILDSLVDYGGYSISSKGFLPAEVDIMVIWIKFTHSHPF